MDNILDSLSKAADTAAELALKKWLGPDQQTTSARVAAPQNFLAKYGLWIGVGALALVLVFLVSRRN